jgi:hypothetical protein
MTPLKWIHYVLIPICFQNLIDDWERKHSIKFIQIRKNVFWESKLKTRYFLINKILNNRFFYFAPFKGVKHLSLFSACSHLDISAAPYTPLFFDFPLPYSPFCFFYVSSQKSLRFIRWILLYLNMLVSSKCSLLTLLMLKKYTIPVYDYTNLLNRNWFWDISGDYFTNRKHWAHISNYKITFKRHIRVHINIWWARYINIYLVG